MRRFSALLLGLLSVVVALGQVNPDSVALANAEWNVLFESEIFTAKRVQVEMFSSTQSIAVVEYDSNAFDAMLAQADSGGMRTTALAETYAATAAINGGYFNTDPLVPCVYERIDGRRIELPKVSKAGYINGVVVIRNGRIGTMPFPHALCDYISDEYDTVMASGPMLVEHGCNITYTDSTSFFRRNPRSFIACTTRGTTLLCVIDGRFGDDGAGMTINETALTAKWLGAYGAINLDGGGSSTLCTAANGIINHPCDNRIYDNRGERIVTNAIVIIPKHH